MQWYDICAGFTLCGAATKVDQRRSTSGSADFLMIRDETPVHSVALGLGVALLCFVTSTPTPYQSGAVDSALQSERRCFRATD